MTAILPLIFVFFFFFFSSRRRHTRLQGDWSSDVCSSDLHALADLQPEPPLDQGLGLRRQPEIVEVEPALPRDLQHVAESPGGDEPDPSASTLDDRVRDHGGAVGDRRRYPGGGAHRRQTGQDAAREVRRGRRDLAGPEPPGALARHEIGEGSADVDADATSHIAPLTAHLPSTLTRVPASAPFGPLDRAMPHAVSWSGPGRWLCAPIACSGRSTSTRRGSVCGS